MNKTSVFSSLSVNIVGKNISLNSRVIIMPLRFIDYLCYSFPFLPSIKEIGEKKKKQKTSPHCIGNALQSCKQKSRGNFEKDKETKVLRGNDEVAIR